MAQPWRERRRMEFDRYAVHATEPWLAQLLDRLTISGVTVVIFECAPAWTLPRRCIADDMFLFVMSGHLFARVGDRALELHRGAAVHFRRGDWHSAEADPRQPLELLSFHYTATVFESLMLAQVLDFPDVFELGGDPGIAALIREGSRLHALQPAGHRRALEAIAGQLLFRLIHDHGHWIKAGRPETKLSDVRRLLPALESLREAMTDPPTIRALARQCGLSESQFRRVFRQTLNLNPVQYQRQMRIETACRLLRQTDQTVDAIAGAVGYAETAFFAHTFKRLTGLSPGRYRQSQGL